VSPAAAAGPQSDAWWVFDVDATLVDGLSGGSFRPMAREVMDELRTAGCTVVWWSAGGAEYAQRRAEQHDATLLVDGFFGKEHRTPEGSFSPECFLPAGQSAVFVDDLDGDPPRDAFRITVRPYVAPDGNDRGLEPVLRCVRSCIGSSDETGR